MCTPIKRDTLIGRIGVTTQEERDPAFVVLKEKSDSVTHMISTAATALHCSRLLLDLPTYLAGKSKLLIELLVFSLCYAHMDYFL